MTDFLKQIASLIQPAPPLQPATAPGVAQSLMEQANLGAGRNPVEAAELRDAARSYLRVVR